MIGADRRAGLRVLRAVAGVGLAAAGLYACSVNVNWPAFRAAFRAASPPWVAAGVASTLLTLSLATLRWGVLLGTTTGSGGGAIFPRSHLRALWDSVVIGQAVNIVFPLRFGEGARASLTCRDLGMPLGRVMVGLAFERALDVAAFGTAVLLLIAAGQMPARFTGVLPGAMTLVLATVVLVAAVLWLLPLGFRWLRARLGPDSRMARWCAVQEESIQHGVIDTSERMRLLTLVVLSALAQASSASTNWLIFRAFDLPVPPVAALVVLVVLQVGTAIVSVPGNVGVFHYLAVATLAAWHVPQPAALAAAVVLHVVSLGPRVLFAAIALSSRRFHGVRRSRDRPRQTLPR